MLFLFGFPFLVNIANNDVSFDIDIANILLRHVRKQIVTIQIYRPLQGVHVNATCREQIWHKKTHVNIYLFIYLMVQNMLP